MHYGRLELRDVRQLYEGPAQCGSDFKIADGTFTYLGGHFAPAAHGGTQTVTLLLVNQSKVIRIVDPTDIDRPNHRSQRGLLLRSKTSSLKRRRTSLRQLM